MVDVVGVKETEHTSISTKHPLTKPSKLITHLREKTMMNKQVILRDMLVRSPKWAKSMILAGFRGSHAHGTYIPPEDPHGTDDIDVFGVTVHPLRYYLGVDGFVRKNDTFNTNREHLDIETHELRKFVHLLEKGNPNVHSYLWMAPEDYFLIDPCGQILVTNRSKFLSQRMLDAFGGYAYSQLSRMQKMEKRGYMGEKREKIVEKYGYDIKNAAHCIRLLIGACSLVREKRLIVKLEGDDLELVLSVKRGERKLEWVQRKAQELFDEFDNLKDSCDLPKSVDREFSNDITERIITLYWENHK